MADIDIFNIQPHQVSRDLRGYSVFFYGADIDIFNIQPHQVSRDLRGYSVFFYG